VHSDLDLTAAAKARAAIPALANARAFSAPETLGPSIGGAQASQLAA